MTYIRRWLHGRGVHRFCRIRREPPWREVIPVIGGEPLDITDQSAMSRVVHF
jgi:hypothetical protein